MASKLPIKNNEIFYNIPLMDDERPKMIEQSKLFKGRRGNKSFPEHIKVGYAIYRDKHITMSIRDKKALNIDVMDYNPKYEKIRNLQIIGSTENFTGIKYLPPSLWSLYIYGFSRKGNLEPSVLPANLRSLTFFMSGSPVNGADLRHLTKLKVIRLQADNFTQMPLLPPSIEYIHFYKATNLTKDGVKSFKIKDHPNIKVLDLRSSLKESDVPSDWKEAKKRGVDIRWGPMGKKFPFINM